MVVLIWLTYFKSGRPDFGVSWIFSKIWIYSVWKNPSLIVLIMKVINFQPGSEMRGSQEITSGIKNHSLRSHVEFYIHSVNSDWSALVWKERWCTDDVITERHISEITLLEKSWSLMCSGKSLDTATRLTKKPWKRRDCYLDSSAKSLICLLYLPSLFKSFFYNLSSLEKENLISFSTKIPGPFYNIKTKYNVLLSPQWMFDE